MGRTKKARGSGGTAPSLVVETAAAKLKELDLSAAAADRAPAAEAAPAPAGRLSRSSSGRLRVGGRPSTARSEGGASAGATPRHRSRPSFTEHYTPTLPARRANHISPAPSPAPSPFLGHRSRSRSSASLHAHTAAAAVAAAGASPPPATARTAVLLRRSSSAASVTPTAPSALARVFRFLDVGDVLACEATCTEWWEASRQDSVWEPLAVRATQQDPERWERFARGRAGAGGDEPLRLNASFSSWKHYYAAPRLEELGVRYAPARVLVRKDEVFAATAAAAATAVQGVSRPGSRASSVAGSPGLGPRSASGGAGVIEPDSMLSLTHAGGAMAKNSVGPDEMEAIMSKIKHAGDTDSESDGAPDLAWEQLERLRGELFRAYQTNAALEHDYEELKAWSEGEIAKLTRHIEEVEEEAAGLEERLEEAVDERESQALTAAARQRELERELDAKRREYEEQLKLNSESRAAVERAEREGDRKAGELRLRLAEATQDHKRAEAEKRTLERRLAAAEEEARRAQARFEQQQREQAERLMSKMDDVLTSSASQDSLAAVAPTHIHERVIRVVQQDVRAPAIALVLAVVAFFWLAVSDQRRSGMEMYYV